MNDLSAYIPEMIETRRYLHRIPEIVRRQSNIPLNDKN